MCFFCLLSTVIRVQTSWIAPHAIIRVIFVTGALVTVRILKVVVTLNFPSTAVKLAPHAPVTTVLHRRLALLVKLVIANGAANRNLVNRSTLGHVPSPQSAFQTMNAFVAIQNI